MHHADETLLHARRIDHGALSRSEDENAGGDNDRQFDDHGERDLASKRMLPHSLRVAAAVPERFDLDQLARRNLPG
ncbi:MAG: hypothetical protein JOZ40_17580 [Methylobacteriaceae bacterium]|nr:hypothetical protein [Methylobacteriaceae bacterium]